MTEAPMDGIECPACGHENISGADTCEECGATLVVDQTEDRETAALQSSLLRLGPRHPESVDLTATLADVIGKLQKRNVGCVLVTGHGEELVGIFTERDVLYRVAGLIDRAASIPVESLMTPKPSTLRPSDPISHALHLMAVHGFRHIPLIDDDGRPVGVVSLRDIIRFMSQGVDVA
ncbi:MAG: CBS domain-containing protein [Candidatus Latescibacterota bacterium]|nr:CBS domain-containing protein [Candidatus Latescibacterota bacterium]MEC8993583.1 CBS domain-containing protein [Candidatus Latescibacterota bacterium]MEE3040959.1 CBS domain-containing protein [Candidatus Latescibacterota bacterium]